MFAFMSAAEAGWAGGSQSRATMRPASSRPASLARLGLLLCLVAGSQQLSISELVVPRSQEAGQDVELQCHVDLGGVPEEAIVVKWWLIQPQERTLLYQRIPPGKPQNVNYTRVEENDSIVLVSVTPARSGEYECEVAAFTPDVAVEQRMHAQLTVYTAGSGPQLNVSQAPGAAEVDITCRVEEVAPEPDLLITIDGVEVNATEEVLGPDAAGLYSAERRVARAPGSVEGSHVQCELLYTDTNVTLHQRYRAGRVYPTGAPREQPTAAAEPAPAAATTPPSGGSDTRHVCWPLLLVLGLFAQLSALL